MKWLRLYHDTITDPKWRLVALDSGQPVSAVLAVWMSMLINASDADERGTLENWDDRVAGAAIDLRGDAVRAIREAMQGLVLNGMLLTGWEKRQRVTDDSSDRVRQYRERLHAGTGRKSTPYVAADIIALDGGVCIYCGSTEKLCVDHMIPLVCGGDHEQDNLACACRRCNSGKAGRTPEQARYEIQSPAAKARYMHALARLGVNPLTVKSTKPGEKAAPSTVTPDDVTVTEADVTVTDEGVTENPLTLTLLPTPTLNKDDDENAGAREIAVLVTGLSGVVDKRGVATVQAWLTAGYHPQLDIYPVVQEVTTRAPGAIGSFRYFTDEINRHHATRTSPQQGASNVHPFQSAKQQSRGSTGCAKGGVAQMRVLARVLAKGD